MLIKLKQNLKNLVLSKDKTKFCKRFNLLNKILKKYQIKLSVVTVTRKNGQPIELFKITDTEKNSLHIARASRLHIYRNGIRERINNLIYSYSIEDISFTSDDLIIDCGANIGEFSWYLQNKHNLQSICVEPEENEFNAQNCNLNKSTTNMYPYLLWENTGYVDFYPDNNTGDSSAFPAQENLVPVQKQAISLDDLLKNDSLFTKKKQIKLLKLEAEGAEPEIIKGASNTLPFIKYIVADCGPERGLSKETTLVEVCNLLDAKNFKLIKFNPSRTIVLFENQSLT
jgi:FkbM family methyltransferase